MTAKIEADAAFYDVTYRNEAARGAPPDPRASPHYHVIKAVIRLALAREPASVLEVGCGNGTLGALLTARLRTRYRGFDFSPRAVELARRRPGLDGRVEVGNALDPAIYARAPFDLLICMEVLEHIERDREVVALWPRGTRLLCTVPNFDADSHVRLFRHEREIKARYGDLMAITRITRFAKPVGAGMTPAMFLRHAWWKRDNPRALAGHFGIRRFDWNSGWFLIEGTRR